MMSPRCDTAAVLGLLVFLAACGDQSGPPVRPAGPAQPEPVATPLKHTSLRTFPRGLERLWGIAIDPRDQLYVVGDSRIRVLDPSGKELRSWATGGPAVCVALGDDGNVYVGLETRVETYDPAGKRLAAWGKQGKGPGEFRTIRAIAVARGFVYVADAGNRCIHRFDSRGDFVGVIADRDDEAGRKGLVCPSAFVDLAVDAKGILHVTNPGLLAVQRYRSDGKLLGQWGEPGEQPHQFTGCCNPTNLALLPDGRIATAEKVVPRVKVYDAERKLLAYIGPASFSKGAAGLDLAVDSGGRLYVADPGSAKVHVFALEE